VEKNALRPVVIRHLHNPLGAGIFSDLIFDSTYPH
jgi:hypothetical protein